MKKYYFAALLLSLLISPFLISKTANAASLAQSLSGRILLSVEQNGEAWYLYPLNLKRYFLGRPDDAFAIMRQLGLGISERDFKTLIDGGTLAKSLRGRIVIQAQAHGEAWYINPVNLKKYYLGRPADAFSIMRSLGLGITINDLLQIPRVSQSGAVSSYNAYRRQTVDTSAGSFIADVVTINLANPNLRISTLSAGLSNCESNCPVKSLARFYEEGRGFAAINGTYFDTSVAKKNYSFYPVYNSLQDVFINENQLVYPSTGPIMAFSGTNELHYFSDTRDFGSLSAYESHYGTLAAAIGNKPRLTESGINILNIAELDEKQRTVKSLRNALAFSDNKMYLIVVRNATVPDLAQVMISLEMKFAMNLDGGGSSALIYDDEYKVGPGRDIVNAIVFSE